MGLLASSCIEQELEEVSKLENSDIVAAKSWYEGFENQNRGQENARKVNNGKGKPDWSKSKVYHQSDGKKVIEVQFDFEEIAIPKHLKTDKLEKTSVLQTLILFPKQDGRYVPYFLNIYPDSPDKKFKLKDFMEGGYQKIPTDFSGVYRFYRWNGDFISGWRVKDGVKTHRIKDLKTQEKKGAGTSARTSNFQLYCYVVETTWFQYTCFEGIGCTTPEEIGTTTNGMECELVMAPPTPGDTGGGGGGGGDPTPTDEECEVPEGNLEGVTVDCDEDEEINLAKLSTCHKLIVNQLIGSTQEGFKRIFEKFSGSLLPPYNFNVKFEYGDCPNSAAGCTQPFLVNNEAKITLNKSILSRASDLSIGRTILHEILHAYFLFLEDFPSANQDLNSLLNYYISKYNVSGNINYNPIHHNLFVENMFLNDIAVELRYFAESLGYPSSVLDNNDFFMDMAWAGLTDTDVYNSLSSAKKVRINSVYYSELTGSHKGVVSIGTKACE